MQYFYLIFHYYSDFLIDPVMSFIVSSPLSPKSNLVSGIAFSYWVFELQESGLFT